jgi:hypothetical protein
MSARANNRLLAIRQAALPTPVDASAALIAGKPPEPPPAPESPPLPKKPRLHLWGKSDGMA